MTELIIDFIGGLIVGWFLFPAPASVTAFWRRMFGGGNEQP